MVQTVKVTRRKNATYLFVLAHELRVNCDRDVESARRDDGYRTSRLDETAQ